MRASSAAVLSALAALVSACSAAGTPPPPDDKGCASCHGDPGRGGSATDQAAPPLDTHGQSSTTLVTVGAHQAHLANGVPCSTCHVVPPAGDTTHIDGPYAVVTFSGNVVGAGGAVVTPWNRDTPTCTNYCHDPRAGGAVPRPLWTQGATLGCGGCHFDQQTATTSTGLHQLHVSDLSPSAGVTCGSCHGSGYATGVVGGAALATHVDGTLQLLPAVGWQDPACSSPRTCYASCHAVKACRYWP